MSAAQHTPGPWWFGITKMGENGEDMALPQTPEYSGEGYGGNPNIYGADGTQVVGCDEYDVFGHWDDQAYPGRREADIRLMVAAPDLLEACKVASALLKGLPRSMGYEFDARQLDAAIAKATVQNETPLNAGMRVSAGENAPVVDDYQSRVRRAPTRYQE